MMHLSARQPSWNRLRLLPLLLLLATLNCCLVGGATAELDDEDENFDDMSDAELAELLMAAQDGPLDVNDENNDQKIKNAMKMAKMCESLAKQGLCDEEEDTPGGVMDHCVETCRAWRAARDSRIQQIELDDPDEFYDLSAKTIHGKTFNFERLEGYISLIINTAMPCDAGFNLEKEGLGFMDRLQETYPFGLNILVFPFEHPQVNYDTQDCTRDLAQLKSPKRKVHVMQTVKNLDKHPVFKFFRRQFHAEDYKTKKMETDFVTYYFINDDGTKAEEHFAVPLQHVQTIVDRNMKILSDNADEDFRGHDL